MNSFLSPLVQELQEFWHVVMIKYENHPLKQVCIRAALTCCTCDVPAVRKLWGFVGHSATMGCSKCAKQFLYDHAAHKLDFSGYDHEKWPIRTSSTHREVCNKCLLAETKVQRKSIEREHGVRWLICHILILLEILCLIPCIISFYALPNKSCKFGSAKVFYQKQTWKKLNKQFQR